MRVTITGGSGMLGHALVEAAPAGVELFPLSRADGDLSTWDGARRAIEPTNPDLVIHCAAWTDVDGCTADPQRAWLNNAVATRNVALLCSRLGARLVALSTDYVFDGAKGAPYIEQDAPHPLNAYGRSKLAAEQAVQETLGNYLIVRTQWLFGPGGNNFVARIIELGRERDNLTVVADQFGSPTYTRDLAGALWDVAARDIHGIMHITNSGQASWAELAAEALCAAGLDKVTINRISAADWPSPTVRPGYCVLANARRAQLGLPPLRPWQEAVREYVRQYLCVVT